ncbi:hypothetical protein [Gorillibacterium massiliense]|uniref:hypothetical protein n=1 Tax=Gorillibacterium massiliense TaxID=1280390 RepID=UPI0004AF56B7|nr:hypothetical protein [Gorillibacterium massiliense]
MRKVIVIGSPGSGKSVFSKALAAKTRLPLIHLDKLYWKAGWVKTDFEEWVPLVAEQTAGSAWIIDGNFQSTLDDRMQKADTVILLDLPRGLCVYRIIKRRLANLGKSRPDMGPNCIEKLDREFSQFLRFVWNFSKISGGTIRNCMEKYDEDGRQMIVLKSKRDVKRFLQEI